MPWATRSGPSSTCSRSARPPRRSVRLAPGNGGVLDRRERDARCGARRRAAWLSARRPDSRLDLRERPAGLVAEEDDAVAEGRRVLQLEADRWAGTEQQIARARSSDYQWVHPESQLVEQTMLQQQTRYHPEPILDDV